MWIHNDNLVLGLEDRRARKRTKKAIMQAPKPSEDEDENHECIRKSKKKSHEKSHAAPRGHASLAFMHGFSSTNVGKHRITVRSISHAIVCG